MSLGLVDAAKMLRMHPTTLAQRARAKLIPGAKNGRAWCFLEEDLVAHIRSQYGAENESQACPSSSVKTVRSGGRTSRLPTGRDYVSQLDALIGKRPKKNTTG